MKSQKKVLAIVAAIALVFTGVTSASAASKTIVCYKGTQSKKVTGTKCPSGWSTTKPKATTKTTAKPGTTTTKGGTISIDATYTGTVTMVWGENDVTVTSVKANGSGNTGGFESLTGNGSATPTSQCTPFDGEGTLGSGADTLKVKYADGALACSADEAAPTVVTIKKGPLQIVSGTGKFAGATGSLTLTGSWKIDSASKGSKPATPVTLKLSGTVTTK